jgi:elongation factor G
MRVYGSDAIRNVAFVGHGASGKTTLVDALAFVSGASRRHGTIKEGTTLTDYTPDEIARQHSISLAVAFAEWMDTKINMLDVPGYLDFFGEAVTGLHAADSAVVVLSGVSGVEVGTEKVWEVCDRLHLPGPVRGSDGKEKSRLRAGVRGRGHLHLSAAGGDRSATGRPLRHRESLSGKARIRHKGTKTGGYDEWSARGVRGPVPEAATSDRDRRGNDDALIERYLDGDEIPATR